MYCYIYIVLCSFECIYCNIYVYFDELSNHVKSNAKTSYYQSEMWYYCTKFDGR